MDLPFLAVLSPLSGEDLPFLKRLSLLWGAGLPSLDDEGRIFVYVDPSGVSPETEEDVPRDNEAGRSQDELL